LNIFLLLIDMVRNHADTTLGFHSPHTNLNFRIL